MRENIVESDFQNLQRLLMLPRQRPLDEVEALINRLRVELLLGNISKRRRNVYRAYVDFLEDAVEARYEKEQEERGEVRRGLMPSLKELIDRALGH